jgi:hypothetical protein
VQGTMYKGSEEHEPTIIWDRKLGSWNGSMVRKIFKNMIQKIKLRNIVLVLCVVKR